MKSRLTLFLGVLMALGLLSFMLLFQVRYDEVAVLTTFGAADAGSVKQEPGLYLRWPPPIQHVYKFPKRLQVLEDQLEELQTADGYSVVTKTYLAWSVQDPLKFFVKLQNVERAQEQIRPFLRDLRKIIGHYRFDELINADPAKLKLTEIENEALAAIREHLQKQGYGVEAEQIGIRRLELPEQVTAKVFDRMKQTRQTMAQKARSEGEAQALAIKNEADAVRQIILAFAENRAQAIRTQGDLEAAQYYNAFRADQDLATFLRRMDTLKKILPHNSTFILDAGQLGLEQMLLDRQPSVVAPDTKQANPFPNQKP